MVLFSGSGCTEEPSLRLSFTGDIIMHIPVKTAARQNRKIDKKNRKSLNNNGFDFLFKNIQKHLAGSDIVQGNMEFPVAPPYTSKPRIFNAPPSVLDALKKTGFTMMSLANNHMLDQGSRGVRATIDHVEKAGLDFIGAHRTEAEARRGIVIEKKNIRVGFLACTGVSNYPIPKRKNYHINWFYHKEKILDDIAAIKKRCDYLVMTVHAGVEYATLPSPKDAALMKEYAEAGVDLIIGHHPHIMQPVEKYQRRNGSHAWIFYSLGNFISNQSSTHRLKNSRLKTSTRDSVIVTCTLKRDDKKIIPSLQVLPIITYNWRDRKTWRRTIQTWSIDDFRARCEKGNFSQKEQIKMKKIVKSLESRVAALHYIINGAGQNGKITITTLKKRTAN